MATGYAYTAHALEMCALHTQFGAGLHLECGQKTQKLKQAI